MSRLNPAELVPSIPAMRTIVLGCLMATAFPAWGQGTATKEAVPYGLPPPPPLPDALEVYREPVTVTVVDPSGQPLKATVTVVGFTIPRPQSRGYARGECPMFLGGPPAGHIYGEARAETDEQGRAELSSAKLGRIVAPDSRCPPGAPCMAPPPTFEVLTVSSPGHWTLSLRRWTTELRVVLVPAPRLSTPAVAYARASAHPRWPRRGQSASLEGRDAPRVCPTIAGSWEVQLPAVTWPRYLPPASATLDATTGEIWLTSCPVQGSVLEIEKRSARRARLRDTATDFVFQCTLDDEAASCTAAWEKGRRVVGRSYAAPPAGCGEIEGPAIGIVAGLENDKAQGCTLRPCVRVR